MLSFRLTDNMDPEERLEEAALWKAMHDEYGDEITSVVGFDSRATFGRRAKREFTKPLEYWDDPAFLKHCRRRFTLASYEGLDEAVAELHGEGKGAFIKSTRDKHAIFKVPVGTDPADVIGDFAYSFMDGGPDLMVQELVKVRYEYRFFVINREMVTFSPNAAHLTPIDWPCQKAFGSPSDRFPAFIDAELLLDEMMPVLGDIALTMKHPDAVIDLAMINGKPGCVEFNPMLLGSVGLFAANVRLLAKGSRFLALVTGTGTAKTAQPVEERSPARTASEAGDAQTLSHKPEQSRSGKGSTPHPSNVGPHTSKGAK